jgi:hypothetical protein
MGDYISQYQQLVCQYRSENATLRRQLSAVRSGTATVRDPLLIPQRDPSLPGTRSGSPAGIPQTPIPKLEQPDVPPLGQGASLNNQDGSLPCIAERPRGISDTHAELASFEEPASNALVYSADVLLSGEVLENSGGGSRMTVDIEPFDGTGRSARFAGEVSLVLVASDGHGGQRNAAKWDFNRDEVQSANVAGAREATMRFKVELPAGTQVGEPTELWARLTPVDGKKLLSHANLDLSRPGLFSSRTDKVWASEESVIPASYIETASAASANDAAVPLNEAAWTTALPGAPVNLPRESDRPEAGWRASSEVVPVAAATAPASVPAPRDSRSRENVATASSQPTASKEATPKPSWSPDRSGKPLQVARPSWSATR